MSKHWLLPEQFRVRLTMDSDWSVGSGMGRPGNVDRLIARDAEDLPFVPAKTLRGVWRDACERLCLALDDGQVGAWSHLVNELFGSQPSLGKLDPTERHSDPANVPLPSAVQIRSARIPSPLRQPLVHADQRIRRALTFVKSGVKIDRRSGSAEANYLRFEEVARRGTILEAECRLSDDGISREVASALLLASSKLVERLGGKRRRGLGRCRLQILDADTNSAIEWLWQTTSAPEWSTAKEQGDWPPEKPVARGDEPWVCVPLVLTLQGPLSISHRTIGNVVESLDFVPGYYLLPHVTRTLGGLGLDVRATLQAGDLCVLPAYPEVDRERSLPVPLALFAPKGVENPLQGANRERIVNRLLVSEGQGTQLKQMREGYVSARSSKVYQTPKTLRTHNTVEDQSQRPCTEVGGVYTYEAIAANDGDRSVVLRSELRLRKSLMDRLEVNWWQKLDGQVSLGRSRKDDYGAVRLETAGAYPRQPCQQVPGKELFVWLVSDMLLRSSHLRAEPTATCLCDELSRRLGVTLQIRTTVDDRINELVRVRRMDTWHVGWRLPRPSFVALQAGSCIVFQVVDGSIEAAKLAQLEAGGIGERTAEGFGQVLFNHPLITKSLAKENDFAHETVRVRGKPQRLAIDSTDPLFAFARLVERECWKHEIRRACLVLANSSTKRNALLDWSASGSRGRPSTSQLGGLRGQIERLRSTADGKQVSAWLEHLRDNRLRASKWPGESIDKIGAIIGSNDKIWDVLNTEGWPVLIERAENELRRELWALAVRTFFDACIRAHKRELERAYGA